MRTATIAPFNEPFRAEPGEISVSIFYMESVSELAGELANNSFHPAKTKRE
jgi:hypothetical protein